MNKLTVYDEDGQLTEVEILDFYQLEEYNHEYVLYTKGEVADKDNLFSYLSILNQISEKEYKFEKITDPEEERKVRDLMNREIDVLMDKR